MERCAVSLPGLTPMPIVCIIPEMPSTVILSRFGFRAASRGVFPPSSFIGLSESPSQMTKIALCIINYLYYMDCIMEWIFFQGIEKAGQIFFDRQCGAKRQT